MTTNLKYIDAWTMEDIGRDEFSDVNKANAFKTKVMASRPLTPRPKQNK